MNEQEWRGENLDDFDKIIEKKERKKRIPPAGKKKPHPCPNERCFYVAMGKYNLDRHLKTCGKPKKKRICLPHIAEINMKRRLAKLEREMAKLKSDAVKDVAKESAWVAAGGLVARQKKRDAEEKLLFGSVQGR